MRTAVIAAAAVGVLASGCGAGGRIEDRPLPVPQQDTQQTSPPAAAPPPLASPDRPTPRELAQQACETYDSLSGRVYIDSTDSRLLRETLHDAREQALEASRQDTSWNGLYGALVTASMFLGEEVTAGEVTDEQFEESLAAFRAVTAECARAGVRLTGT
jgi:hypothetical protein